MNKGLDLDNLGQYEEVIEYFNKILNIDSDFVDALEHKKLQKKNCEIE